MPKINLTSAHRIKSANTEFDQMKGVAGPLWTRHPLEQHYGNGPNQIPFHLCHRNVNKTGQFQPTRNFAPLAVNMTNAVGTANVNNKMVNFTPTTEIHLDNGLDLSGCHIVFVVDLSKLTSAMGFMGKREYPASGIRVGNVQSNDTVFMTFIQKENVPTNLVNRQTVPRFPIPRTGLSILHALITPDSIKSWVHDLVNNTVATGSVNYGYSNFIIDSIGNGQNISPFAGQMGEVVVVKQGDNSQSIVDGVIIPYLKGMYA